MTALIVVVPMASASTNPMPSTVATSGALDVHRTLDRQITHAAIREVTRCDE